jgi:cytoskeletal protein CcmA (bactofilin family)
MKRIIGIVLGMLALSGVLFIGAAHAINARSGNTVVVGKGETVDSSLYIAGSNVTIDGTIKGDVFCAGQTVEINGTVEGDVICAGQTVRVGGQVQGNVRVAAQSATITAPIGGSLTVAGQSVTLADGASIGRDVTAYGQSLSLRGKVGRDVVGGGQQMTLNGEVGRDVELSGDRVTLENSARINGNLNYHSNNQADIRQGATVNGRTKRYELPKQANRQTNWFAAALGGAVYWFLALTLIGAVLLLAVPRLMRRSVQIVRNQTWLALGIGLVVLLLTPIVAFMLLFTVIGIPLAFALILTWLVMCLLALAVAGYELGDWLTGMLGFEQWRTALSLVLGLGVLAIISLVPVLGWLAVLLALLWGLGSLALSLRPHLGEPAKTVTRVKAG